MGIKRQLSSYFEKVAAARSAVTLLLKMCIRDSFPILVNSNNDCLRVSADAKGIDLKVVNTAGAVIKQHRIDKKNK